MEGWAVLLENAPRAGQHPALRAGGSLAPSTPAGLICGHGSGLRASETGRGAGRGGAARGRRGSAGTCTYGGHLGGGGARGELLPVSCSSSRSPTAQPF